MNIIADTYAWIEIFLGSREGAKVRRLVEEAEEVRTPDVVLAEIARKYFREGVNEAEIEKRLRVIHATTIITPIDSAVALLAAKAYFELFEKARKEKLPTPSLFDAILLATARAYQAKAVTGDKHLKNLPETILI